MDDNSQALSAGFTSLWPFAASAAAGLVLGLERRQSGARIGLKTFILIALLGALVALVAEASGSASVLAAGLVAVGVAAGAGAWREAPGSHEISTTLLAAVWCFSLGAATWYGYAEIALALAVLSAVLLRLSAPRGGAMLRWAPGDIAMTVQFTVLMLALLPLAADQEYEPYGVLNPYHIWLVVALLVGISWAGYALWRLTDSGRSALGHAVLGGTISPTFAVASCSRAAARDASCGSAAALTVTFVSLAALVRVTAVAAAAEPAFFPGIAAIPLGAIAFSLPVVVIRARRGGKWGIEQPGAIEAAAYRNPAGLGRVLAFAAVYGAALILTSWLSDTAGKTGLFGISLLGGIATGEPFALAALKLGSIGNISERAALVAFACALVALVLAKFLIARRLGGSAFGRQCLPLLFFSVVGICLGTLFALAVVPAGR